MATLGQWAKEFNRSLKQPRRDTLALWTAATAVRLQKILKTNRIPGGGRIPACEPYTKKFKKKVRARRPERAGVRFGDLVDGIKNSHQVLTGESSRVFASDGRDAKTPQGRTVNNDVKINAFVKGTDTQKKRDFVTHDRKVVEKHAKIMLKKVARDLRL